MENILSVLDVPNTAFMLLCTSLVMLMTPGLAFFYGGLVSRKSVITIMSQSFFSMGWVAIIWFMVGYSLSFGPSINGIIGDPFYYAFLNNINPQTMYTGNDGGLPILVHFSYQMMFAIITPALITGAFANRVNFPAYLIFLTLWTLFVYCPFVHMVWSPDGIFAKWGVVDFAGGIVVHATAGFAAIASALYVGKRMVPSDGTHNIPYIALGAALLWFGWYGFNAGSELQVNTVTVSAFLTTDIAAAFAAVTWFVIERLHTGKPKLVGFLTGAVAGLATITPASGYVSIGSAAIIGIIASLVCYFFVFLVRRHLDDALDVFGVHGVGGITGSILVGVFASTLWNPKGPAGLLEGNGMQVVKQFVAVVFTSVWSFVFTLLILWIINKFTSVKVNQQTVGDDLDITEFDEDAYRENTN
ncbi:ammonium transporter [Providencia stuartii]|uniref:ammonium transporter n=1 Tax=Providencia TaxID=586 RepID=UPI00069FB449|nr:MULTISPECIES: ammonium transporter [Providencia]AMG65385.1 ammonium transporter [Providencia stuartii]EMD1717751.1 ammonium transporter [Providencia stuartii]KNZ84721.1 ammonium transporter [Providencia stuartii]MBG5908891.1 ammonium transporter [Providencia stuartii]MDN0017651.1 ammonium transporter [Providencia stuartii]